MAVTCSLSHSQTSVLDNFPCCQELSHIRVLGIKVKVIGVGEPITYPWGLTSGQGGCCGTGEELEEDRERGRPGVLLGMRRSMLKLCPMAPRPQGQSLTLSHPQERPRKPGSCAAEAGKSCRTTNSGRRFSEADVSDESLSRAEAASRVSQC